MIKIKIITVGKIKEKFYRDAIDEYAKRLSKYCKFEIIEVADEKTPDKCSETEEQLILSKEADKILKHVRQDMFVYALAIKGKKLDSVAFANEITFSSGHLPLTNTMAEISIISAVLTT